MILQTEGASIATRSMSTSVDGNGDFCFKVPPGVHTIQVIGCTVNAIAFENFFVSSATAYDPSTCTEQYQACI